jgi:hypothetical protein
MIIWPSLLIRPLVVHKLFLSDRTIRSREKNKDWSSLVWNARTSTRADLVKEVRPAARPVRTDVMCVIIFLDDHPSRIAATCKTAVIHPPQRHENKPVRYWPRRRRSCSSCESKSSFFLLLLLSSCTTPTTTTTNNNIYHFPHCCLFSLLRQDEIFLFRRRRVVEKVGMTE